MTRARRYFVRPVLRRPDPFVRLGLTRLEDRTAPAVFTVSSTANAGPGTLRQAITDANTKAGTDDIVFDLGSGAKTITLTAALPSITQSTNLLGPGANLLTVTRDTAGAALFRIFNFSTSGKTASVLKGMTITGGKIASDGAGIQLGGFVTIDSCAVTGNAVSGANDGGGIRVNAGGFLRVVNSTISGNTARCGGGIYFYGNGSLLLENSTISGNVSTGTDPALPFEGGGGVYFYGTASNNPPAGFTAGAIVVRNSTISGNTTTGSGGGINTNYLDGDLLVQNSTITGNTAAATDPGFGGGGISMYYPYGELIVTSSIISGNTNANGGAITNPYGDTTINFSAVDDTNGFTLSGTSGNNLSTADSTVVALQLGALANNGGLTKTHSLGPTSKALNAGSNPVPATTDQRGLPFVRTFGTSADIGAYEVQPPGVSIDQGSSQADPTAAAPIVFDVVFSEPVSGFTGSDVAFTGSTVGGTLTAVVSGTGAVYTVSVSGMTGTGTVVVSIPAGAATAVAGGLAAYASVSTDNVVLFDLTPPNVSLSSTAPDPTNQAVPVTVTFDEAVMGFTDTDLSPTNGTIANFAGFGKTYTFDLTPTGQGLASVTLPAGTVTDLAGNLLAVGSNTISRTYDSVAPTVTIDQAVGQVDPTPVEPIQFTVVFNEPVTGFDGADVVLTGTAMANTAVVSGSGTTYTVTVTGMTRAGTVIAAVAASGATDAAGNGNADSTGTDNTVFYNPPNPTVTVEQDGGQADPINQSPILFTVTFDRDVTGFDQADVILGGTANPTTVVVTGTGPVYTLAVTGMTAEGTVTASIPAGAVTGTAEGFPNKASTSTDNTVTFDPVAPGATLTSTAPPVTNSTPVPVVVTFTESVNGFDETDLTLVNATAANFSGSGTDYTFDLIPSGQGTVSVSVAAGKVTDLAGNPGTASNLFTRQFDDAPPVPTIKLGSGLSDPTAANPVVFAVTFDEPVTGFDKADLILGGTAGAKTATVTGSGTSYTVSVTGMTTSGTVALSIRADAASDQAGNKSSATGPVTVGYDNVAPAVTVALATGQANQTNVGPVKFLLTFGEPVVPPSPDAMGTSLSTVNPGLTLAVNALSASEYEVVVSNVHGTGAVVLTVPAGVTKDLAGNPSKAPTVTGNSVTFDDVPPAVVIAPASGQTNPTTANPMKFTVTFSEAVTGFDNSDVVFGGTAKPTAVSVTGSGKSYVIAVSGMSRRGTVTVSVPAGAATDALGNPSTAGSVPDQTYSPTAGGVPVGSEVELTVTGADAGGGPHVQVYNPNGTNRFSFFAYAPTFIGGVRVATGDANGDGTEDIITAAGPGGGPHVKLFDGAKGKEMWGFYAFDPSFTGGVNVATADFNGDGIVEIVVGAGPGGGPHVKVIDLFTGTVRRSFFAYDAAFRGGVNVTTGDVTGDGVPDIITGAGAGGSTLVHVYDGVTGNLVRSFSTAGGSPTSGLFVTAGNFLGDDRVEIAVARASGTGGSVLVYDGGGNLLQTVTLPPGFQGANGLRIAAGTKQPGSAHSTLLVAPGPGVAGKIRRFGDPSLTFLDEFAPYSANFLGGIYVA